VSAFAHKGHVLLMAASSVIIKKMLYVLS
jgi:hypothetical protein